MQDIPEKSVCNADGASMKIQRQEQRDQCNFWEVIVILIVKNLLEQTLAGMKAEIMMRKRNGSSDCAKYLVFVSARTATENSCNGRS